MRCLCTGWLLDTRVLSTMSLPTLEEPPQPEQNVAMSNRVNPIALVTLLLAACSSPGPNDTGPADDAGPAVAATTGGSSAVGTTAATGGNSSTGGSSSRAQDATGGACTSVAACGVTYDCALDLCGSMRRDLCLTARDDGGTVRTVTGLGQVTCSTEHVQDYWLTCCSATCEDGGAEYQCGRVPG